VKTARQEAGARAEEVAARFLAAQGLEIIARNFRTRLGEIDVVARDGGTLVFVEVRLRTREDFGGALESIDERKQSRIARAANGYLGARGGREPPCRFDVITVEGREARWIKAAFEAAPG
jgi:putative endonuclease